MLQEYTSFLHLKAATQALLMWLIKAFPWAGVGAQWSRPVLLSTTESVALLDAATNKRSEKHVFLCAWLAVNCSGVSGGGGGNEMWW